MRNIQADELIRLQVPELLRHHDLVFNAPVCDPACGLPIGNGSTGCLLWLSPEKLHIQINHTDLIDDVDCGVFYYKREDETHAVCRNGGRLTLDFGCPVFETIYQKDFQNRLRLGDATAELTARTPFSSVQVQAFASEAADCAIVQVQASGESPLRCILERWGSRTFQYWYMRFADDPGIGLNGTEAATDSDFLTLSQQLGGQYFSIALLPVSDTPFRQDYTGKHQAGIAFLPAVEYRLTLYIAVSTGLTRQSAIRSACGKVRQAAKAGFDNLHRQHSAAWADFWNRSFIALPEELDFVENLWYLNLYYGNCQMKGQYPPHFCNGVWGFYHDFVPWNLYFHYNTQHAMNSYSAANHPELLQTYFRFRRKQLPIAEKYAAEVKKTSGAFYTDISDMLGRMVVDKRELANNCTCGAQIAMLMYKHYRYSGDEAFLQDTALPVMESVGRFYLDMLRMGPDGYYHISDTTAYEGTPPFDDCITDLCAIRALFHALIQVLDPDASLPYRQHLEKLTDFTSARLDPDETAGGCFVHGIGKGRASRGDRVLTVGTITAGKESAFRGNDFDALSVRFEPGVPVRKTFGTVEKQNASYYGFPDPEFAPLYPSGLAGIKDRGSELYNMLYNSICMHHPALESSADPTGTSGMCMGWCMMPIYLARMGMADDLIPQLKRSVSTWIPFPQGFGIYSTSDYGKVWNLSPRSRAMNLSGPYHDQVVDFNRSALADKPECWSVVPLWNFRHFNYETLPILATAVNEMLLQSYDGTLRLFASIRKTDTVAFRLAAEGGYLVHAMYAHGDCAATLQCSRDGLLRIIFTHVEGTLRFRNADGTDLHPEISENEYCLPVRKGQTISITSEHGDSLTLAHEDLPNTREKVLGDARLGAPREF